MINREAAAYWITRWSLSSGSPKARPVAGDDDGMWRDDLVWRNEKRPHSPTSFSHSSSVSTATPCFFASASFEPAPGPATT
jgi:hypothetical protein